MNANVNTYFERKSASVASDSDSIRRAYIARSRKEAFVGAADSALIWYLILALKAAVGLFCVISFFSILGKIELGTISPFAGILATLLIAGLECLCFVPLGKRPTKKSASRR